MRGLQAMIDKYYNGVIEQVYGRVGREKRNIVMASYNNDFSVAGLGNIKRYQEPQDNVFFAWHEFEYDVLAGAYEPFLGTVCDMYRIYNGGDFKEFLQECDVYELHRDLLLGYYEKGKCCRNESVLLNEVRYEQYRMTTAITDMLKSLAAQHPLVIVINRFQLAAKSTMEVVKSLLREPSENIGLVLGVNEMQPHLEAASGVWDSIVERLEDHSQIYHIGSSGRHREQEYRIASDDYSCILERLEHIRAFLDYDQVKYYCQQIEHKIAFEEEPIEEEIQRDFYLLYAHTSVLLAELPKALELVDKVERLQLPDEDRFYHMQCAFLKATCLMYQGKLDQADSYAKEACEEAKAGGDPRQVFRAELLVVMARMSGWYNIFFCVQDIPIEESFIQKILKYNYKNHLAHIYIYAYDNSPEVVAKACSEEESLSFFGKGIELAKEIGNEQLVEEAFQKNIMLASTNGMNEIALLYSLRSYQFMKSKNGANLGRVVSGIGYNLSALGYYEKADEYYNRAIELFYQLRLPEDIAEVYYNRSLNYIVQRKYAQAENDLLVVMKTIEKLHLNSLRVCNVSKLYGLLALACILQEDRFGCGRYLLNCRQFLNYIIEKERENRKAEVIHDYTNCDDDMFVYHFAQALLNRMDEDEESALKNFEEAERYLTKAEGNMYFSYCIFREKRMEQFEKLGMEKRRRQEQFLLEKYREAGENKKINQKLLREVDLGSDAAQCRVSEESVESLIKQEGVMRDYLTSKRQIEFISTWQKLIDVSDMNISDMVHNAIRAFTNQFSLDCALYICYHGDTPQVLYNDTGRKMTQEVLREILSVMKEYPQGFAVSKISDSFLEHQDVISFFGVDEVCSFVAVPFRKNEKTTSLLLTYVQMKDNWHGSIDRYMLDEDDLNIYRLLFREMEYAITRMEANIKVFEMNRRLKVAAVTDMLTGIYNRAGMYERIHQMVDQIQSTGKPKAVSVMFIDLDNFKPYNDTYGHDVGDIILKGMADIFLAVSSGKGFASRFGGDEFIIVVETADKGKMENLAKNIYRRIDEAEGFQRDIERFLGHKIQMNQSRYITCSIGIAQSEEVREEEDFNWLISRADDLLYSVKTREKGHYTFYENDTSETG